MTSVAHPLASLLKVPDEDFEMQDDDELGVGTSSGAGYRGLGGSRPMTVDSLLQERISFVPAQSKHEEAPMPYTAINIKAPPPALQTPNGTSSLSSPAVGSSTAKTPISPAGARPLAPPPPTPFFPPISASTGWHQPLRVGAGLDNAGNTCFLNSALQVLLHTAPLVRYFEENPHPSPCPIASKNGFCMMCAFRLMIKASFTRPNSHPYEPTVITRNLKKVAQHLRVGRQEDAHEFLRFCIDGLQKSALFGKPLKLDQKIKESTFIHQIFGGRLRSRVVCSQCHHPSDTFDRILDLSLDVQRVGSIKEALQNFVKIDKLQGANKYKCEKCKKLVVAEKSFTIDEAPMVLTIHLKRFTAAGRKISETIHYPETLRLGPYMSDKSIDPCYRLYGVILHSGGGPNSGHYTAEVKAPTGVWYNMNDSTITSIGNRPPNVQKNAYVLFYCRDRGDALNAAIHSGTSGAMNGGGHVHAGMNGGGKRPRESDGGRKDGGAGEVGQSASKKKFIGPQAPTPILPSSKPPGDRYSFPTPAPTTISHPNPYDTSNYTSNNATTSSTPTPFPAPRNSQSTATSTSPPRTNGAGTGLYNSKGNGQNSGKGNKKLKIPTVGNLAGLKVKKNSVVGSLKKRSVINAPQTIRG